MTQSVCIIGGGISGAALAWSFAKAQEQWGTNADWQITLIHDQSELGGHAWSHEVEYNGTSYNLDIGVQMIAPPMYPNTMCMLDLPEFTNIKAGMAPVELAISAAFAPETAGGPAQYWGNFPAYQQTALWQSGATDCQAFEKLLDAEPAELISLAAFLADHQSAFQNSSSANFETYFLDPFLSILNGYKSPLTNQLFVPEMAFMFDHNLASFENATTGFRRYGTGANSFPQQMGVFAKAQLGSALNILYNTSVQTVTPTVGGPVSVTYQAVDAAAATTATFDWVVIAVDQANAGNMLSSSNLWSGFYDNYVGQEAWQLYQQWCYLHTDAAALAPGMPNPPQETLQYNEYYGADYGYATYISANVCGLGPQSFNDFPYLVTMYAFDPTQVNVPGFPVPNPIVPPSMWWHGQWLPSFFWERKVLFHEAQGISPYAPPRPNQRDTHVFFAGNNLTMDSEEGALVSALALAHYGFNIPAIDLVSGANPFTGQAIWSLMAYFALFNLMFPGLMLGVSEISKRLLAMDHQSE